MGILTDPSLSAIVSELMDLTSTVATELDGESLNLASFPRDVLELADLSRQALFNLGPVRHADTDQSRLLAASCIAAVDVIGAACDQLSDSEKALACAKDMRDRGDRVVEQLKEIERR